MVDVTKLPPGRYELIVGNLNVGAIWRHGDKYDVYDFTTAEGDGYYPQVDMLGAQCLVNYIIDK